MAKLPNPIDQSVGGKVKAQRLRMGLSQEKLGEALGLTFQQVQKYEKGSNRISASKLQQIAQTLNVPPAFFWVRSTHSQPMPDAAIARCEPSFAMLQPWIHIVPTSVLMRLASLIPLKRFLI